MIHNAKFILSTLLASVLAIGSVESPAAGKDINIKPKEIRHRLNCPLPSESKCAAKRTIPFGYTVLSENIDVDINGEFWLIDFKRTKPTAARKVELRILSDEGVLHIIEAQFPEANFQTAPQPTPNQPNQAIQQNSPLNVGGKPEAAAKLPINNLTKADGGQSITLKKTALDPSVKGLAYTDVVSYCDAIKKNKTLNKYVALLAKFSYYEDKVSKDIYSANRPHFDNKSRQLSGFADSNVDIMNSSNVADLLTGCAFQLKDTKLFPLFGLEKLELEEAVKSAKKAQSIAPSNDNNSQRDKRFEGPLRNHSGPFFNNKFKRAVFHRGDSPLLATLLLENGTNEINVIENEVFSDLKNKLDILQKNHEKISRERDEFNKTVQVTANRLKKILKGDLKSGKNCLEVAIGLGANTNNGLLPGISPKNEIRALAAKLLDYEEGNVLKGGFGKVSLDGNFGIFKTSSNTIWFDKDRISPGNSEVFIVGRYVANEQLKLNNGTFKKAPLFNALCVSLDIQIFALENLLLYESVEKILDDEASKN